MIFQGITFAKLITTNQDDFDFLKLKYENTGVIVELSNYTDLKESNLPTLFLEKKYSSLIDKDHYNIIEILDSNIKNNQQLLKKIDFLLEKIVYSFHPYEYVTYDAILNGELFNFLFQEIDSEQYVCLYFHKKCLYLYCSGKLISISLESIKFVYGNFKSIIDKIFQKFNCYIFSFQNYKKYVSSYSDLKPITFENIVWCKHALEIDEFNLFKHFAGISIYRNIPYLMDVYIRQNQISDEELISTNRYYKKDIITEWLSTRTVYFDKKIQGFNLKSDKKVFYTNFNYSNKRTITGRINSFDEQINLQTLPKNSEIKNNIISRYENGKIVVFDYVSFESRIAIFATGDIDFINKFKEKDIHTYVAQLIFDNENITNDDRAIGKLFNHTLLFGGGEERLKTILKDYDSKINFEEKYNKIITELNPIIELSYSINQEFQDYGYIRNAYGVIIRPRKKYAAFNNFIQSTAADIVVEKLFYIKEFIDNKKINFLYQVYDSFVLDFDESEINKISEIKNMLSQTNKISFLINYQIGNNLMDCSMKEFETWNETN